MNDELLDIASGNPRLAAFLHQALNHMADGNNDLLREMSNAVLHDGASLRGLAASETYGAALGDAFGRAWEERESLAEEHRGREAEATDILGAARA